MTKEEKRAKRKETLKQNREFANRLNILFAKKFRYSLRYEDALVKDDGKAYVNVDLTKIKSPFSVFSYDRRMDPEIYDYIDSCVYYLRASIPVVINFDDGGKYSEDLKDKIRKCVIRHYSLEYEDKRLEHRKSIMFGSVLVLFGLLLLVCRIIFSKYWSSVALLSEFTLIISWMLIWQGADFFFVSGHTKRVEITNSGQLALAEVTFGKPIH